MMNYIRLNKLLSLNSVDHLEHKVHAYQKMGEYYPVVDGHVVQKALPSESAAIRFGKQWIEQNYKNGKKLENASDISEFDVHSVDPARLGAKMDRLTKLNKTVESRLKKLASPNWVQPHEDQVKIPTQGGELYVAKNKKTGKWSYVAFVGGSSEDNTGYSSKEQAARDGNEMLKSMLKE